MKTKNILLLILSLCLFNTTVIFASNNFSTEKGSVTEYYINTKGEIIKSKTKTTIDSIYEKEAPKIDGYVCINARINDNSLYYTPSISNFDKDIVVEMTSFNSDGDYVLFIYSEDESNSGYPDDASIKQDVIIRYYDYNTGKVINTQEKEAYIGSNFEFEPSTNKTFDDVKYTFYYSEPDVNSEDEVNIFVSSDEDDNFIDLYYKQGNSKNRYITVKQIDIESNEEIDTDNISDVNIGTKYKYSVQNISGYNFVSSSPSASSSNVITLTVDSDNDENVIYCYYKKNYNDSNIWYDDNNRYYVSPTDTYFNEYNYIAPVTSQGVSLNKDKNYSFARGYTDGTFKPNNYITRAEVSQMFYNISNDKSMGNYNYYFKDLDTSDWYYTSMYYLASRGIINGYSDSTIRPNSYITRAEFVKIATNMFGFNNTDSSVNFSDVSYTDWYYDYVKAGSNLNLINGYSDGEFKPNDYITRAEAVTVIDNILGRTQDDSQYYAEINYNDVNYNDWYYTYIKMATSILK